MLPDLKVADQLLHGRGRRRIKIDEVAFETKCLRPKADRGEIDPRLLYVMRWVLTALA